MHMHSRCLLLALLVTCACLVAISHGSVSPPTTFAWECPSWHPEVLCERFWACEPWRVEDFSCSAVRPSAITFVVGLYDVQRGKEGRLMEQYMSWLYMTLGINASFILYSNADTRQQISGFFSLEQRTPSLCYASAARNPLEGTVPFVTGILHRSRKKAWKRAAGDLVFSLPGYSPVIHSKFAFLLHAMEWNPFSSSHFYWTDAGTSRFFISPPADFARAISNAALSDRILMEQTSQLPLSSDLNANPKRLIGSASGALIATTFGGPRAKMQALSSWVLCHFFDMLNWDRIDTEQVVLILYYLRMRHDIKTVCAQEAGLPCDVTFPGKGTHGELISYLYTPS